MNSALFDKNFINKSLLKKTFIENIYLFDKINSTNEFAKNIKENNVLILAEHQESGNGRFGKTWYTEKHKNLTFTIGIEVVDVIPSVINFITSLTTLQTMESFVRSNNVKNAKFSIKWPNDIILNKRKVSGILIEKKRNFYIIGVGINVNQVKFDISIRDSATSLFNEFTKQFDKNKILVKFIKNLDKQFKSVNHENFELIYSKWLKKSFLLNKSVKFNNKIGIVKDFTLNGGIIINSGGQSKTYYSSNISLDLI